MVLLSPVMLFALLLLVLSTWNEVQRFQIRNEIISYVEENANTIELDNPSTCQEFFYTATGLQDGSVEYGYYYSPDDVPLFQGEPYRRGYRIYGIPDDRTDWCYSERICENWFYYEIHDG